MALNLEIRSLVDSVLTEFSPIGDRTVYSRVLVKTGGDALLNTGQTVTSTDTLLVPQPVYSRLMFDEGSFDRVALVGTSYIAPGDYEFVISLNSIDKESLLDSGTQMVLKLADETVEVLKLIGYDAVGVKGMDVVFIGYYRSVKRG
jgi:hypothetical protein